MIANRVRSAFLTVITVGFVASCGTDHPAAPPAPVVDIDWEAVERLLADPLYTGLPAGLTDRAGAQPIHDEVRLLVASLARRDLPALRSSLSRLESLRGEYAARPSFHVSDTVILLTMWLFEARASRYLGEEAATPRG